MNKDEGRWGSMWFLANRARCLNRWETAPGHLAFKKQTLLLLLVICLIRFFVCLSLFILFACLFVWLLTVWQAQGGTDEFWPLTIHSALNPATVEMAFSTHWDSVFRWGWLYPVSFRLPKSAYNVGLDNRNISPMAPMNVSGLGPKPDHSLHSARPWKSLGRAELFLLLAMSFPEWQPEERWPETASNMDEFQAQRRKGTLIHTGVKSPEFSTGGTNPVVHGE